MPSSHAVSLPPTPHPALGAFLAFLDERRSLSTPLDGFESFEGKLHELLCAVSCEATAEELSRHDQDVPLLLVDGKPHRRVLRASQTYLTPLGEVVVTRNLYRPSGKSAPSVCPLELRVGIVDGIWTPRAAKQALWLTAQLPPGVVAECYERLGGLMPSKRTLDRLPKAVSAEWEAHRPQREATLRAQEKPQPDSVAVAAGLDGVMLPMKDGQRQEKREQATKMGKRTRGPSGRKEVACGTLTQYDKEGEPLHTTRMARMPEAGKATLKSALTAELLALLVLKPELVVVLMGDGCRDNWTYLDELALLVEQRTGRAPEQLVDFCHGAEHLARALNAAHGENTPKAKAEFERLRHDLKHQPTGVRQVVQALCELSREKPRQKVLKTEAAYFFKNRHRMKYAALVKRKLPIGTGMTEAACKTLVTQRLRCSGMSWRTPGGQAILTLRALTQSKRFDRAWKLIAKANRRRVQLPEKVTALRPRGPR